MYISEVCVYIRGVCIYQRCVYATLSVFRRPCVNPECPTSSDGSRGGGLVVMAAASPPAIGKWVPREDATWPGRTWAVVGHSPPHAHHRTNRLHGRSLAPASCPETPVRAPQRAHTHQHLQACPKPVAFFNLTALFARRSYDRVTCLICSSVTTMGRQRC